MRRESLRQLCPRDAAQGKIFRKSVWLFPGMYERCPACGLKFEREDGYFLGAMYIGYGLGVGAIACLRRWCGKCCKWPLMKSVVGGSCVVSASAPVLTWMARVLWIYMDQAIDPDAAEQWVLIIGMFSVRSSSVRMQSAEASRSRASSQVTFAFAICAPPSSGCYTIRGRSVFALRGWRRLWNLLVLDLARSSSSLSSFTFSVPSRFWPNMSAA